MKSNYMTAFFLALILIMGLNSVEGAQLNLQPNILYKMALNEYIKGHPESSILFYRYIIELNPNNPLPYLNIAAIYKENGQLKDSMEYLRQGVAENPTNLPLKLEKARLHLLLGQAENALAILNDETDRDSLFYKGLALIQLEQWEEAIGTLKRATFSDYRFAIPQYLLGICLWKIDKPEEAIDALENALSLERSFKSVNLALANINFELGNFERALSTYRSLPTSLLTEDDRSRINEIVAALPPPPPPPPIDVGPPKERVVRFIDVVPFQEETFPTLRVALFTNGKNITLQAGSDFIIERCKDGEIIYKGNARQTFYLQGGEQGVELLDSQQKSLVLCRDKTRIVLTDAETTLAIFDVAYGQGYYWGGVEDRQYRGSFIIDPLPGGSFQFINEVNIEEYLLSTVPSEMPASWPAEALKAQAIAARSYILLKMQNNRDAAYHVVESVLNAVYKGVSWENPRSTQAVIDTTGIVATYNNQIIDAVFSSNSGGHTEDASFVWGGDVPYLQAKNMGTQNRVFPQTPYHFDQWIRNWEPAYSFSERYGAASSYRWTRILLPTEPPVVSQVGRILNIVPQGRGTGGSINAVRVIGEKGEVVIKGDSIRMQLGDLKSNRFVVEPFYMGESQPAFFMLWGGGWGHSVGLDQTAAAEMASLGFPYEAILKYFYEGISLKKIH